MVRRPIATLTVKRVKIVITLKPRFFRGGGETNFEEQFLKLSKRLSGMQMDDFVVTWFGVNEAATTETNEANTQIWQC